MTILPLNSFFFFKCIVKKHQKWYKFTYAHNNNVRNHEILIILYGHLYLHLKVASLLNFDLEVNQVKPPIYFLQLHMHHI